MSEIRGLFLVIGQSKAFTYIIQRNLLVWCFSGVKLGVNEPILSKYLKKKKAILMSVINELHNTKILLHMVIGQRVQHKYTTNKYKRMYFLQIRR